LGLGNKSLSLVMIVRDEESCLPRCLDSAAALADEIVIVDTGSTDRTVEIAREYDAVIFSFPWGNDFAAARNFSVEKATMDWVLWLDADEEIAPESLDLSIESGLLEQYDALAVPLVNIFGKTVDHDQVVQIAQPRLFKNHLGFRFENQIHEWLNILPTHSDSCQNRGGFLVLSSTLRLYGPLGGKHQKSERNVNLLLQDLKKIKDHACTHYYLRRIYRPEITDAL
jgi:glycosyltransferase involved in cell wall biosynthesis